jgi:SOS-response transcriptional repressor LexA
MRVHELASTEFLSVAISGRVLAGTTGFQSPADDYEQGRIDLTKELVTTVASVFCMRVEGGSMVDVGIFDGDIIVADRARTPRSGDIVIADVHLEYRSARRLAIGACPRAAVTLVEPTRSRPVPRHRPALSCEQLRASFRR